MSNKQYLQSRSGWYSYRRKFPKDIREFLGKELFVQALNTSDLQEAILQRPMAEIEFNNEVSRYRQKIKPQETREATDAEMVGIAISWFKEQLQMIEEYCDEEATSKDEILQIVREGEDLEGSATDALAYRELDSSGVLARRMLAELGLHIPENSPKFLQLQKMLTRGTAEGGRAQQKRAIGDYKYQPSDPLFKDYAIYDPPQRVAKDTKTLEDLIDAYSLDMKPKWKSPKTTLKYDLMLRVIRDVIGGNRPLQAIDRPLCREVLEVFKSLPSSYTKRPELVGKSPREAAKLNQKLGYPPLSPTSINDYLRQMVSLFDWGIAEDMMDKNPALKLGVANKVKAKDKRDPFTMEALETIFNAPLYTGCINDQKGYSKVGPNVIRGGRFWVPLLSLWTGMRLNECCQLHLNDIAVKDGVDVILINDDIGDADEVDGKKIKTDAGERFVPIHPELIRMGFLKHIETMRDAKETRVFPDLKKAKTGYYSDYFSRWFSRFLESCGVKEDKNSFHSFRHNFRDALREADVHKDKANAISGWSQGNDTSDNYGSGYKAHTLYDEIVKIEYEGLDLRHLYI